MTLKLKDKQAIVVEVGEIAKMAHSAVIAEYRGLTVEAMTQLRVEARGAGVCLRVVRNTLARRAFEGTLFACLQASLVGPLVLAFSQQEPSAAARLVRAFAKDHEKLVVKQLAFEGRLLAAKDLDKLANLPTRGEAIANLMAVIKAPVMQLVRTLVEPTAKLTRLLAVVRDKQELG